MYGDAKCLVFDLETYALDDAGKHVAPPNLEACRAPSSWKDPVKIAAEVERKRVELIEEHQQKLERCALDWNLSRIVALGYCVEGQDIQAETLSTEDAEREAN